MGYTLDKVRLPEQPGVPGTLEFVVDSHRGTPQTEFLMEQTKRIHVYVVREDLSIFRHVHPTMANDGTWTSPLTLPTPGRYRVVVEFIAKDEGGNGDHVILGDAASVGGIWLRRPVAEAGTSVTVDGVIGLIADDHSPVPGTLRRLGLALDREAVREEVLHELASRPSS